MTQIERTRPVFDDLKQKVISALPPVNVKFTAYSITQFLFPSELNRQVWLNKYQMITNILFELEKEGKVKSKLKKNTGKLLPKRSYVRI